MSPSCILRPVPGPPLMGMFDRLLVFGIPNGFGHNNSAFSLIIMSVLLLVLAYRVLFSAFARSLPLSDLRMYIGMYTLITGVFFVTLFTNLNIIVISFAALHNLLEWMILGSIVFDYTSRRWYFAKSVIFIWMVWLISMQIPDVLVAFGFEETMGLWPDWTLFLVSMHLAFKAQKNYKHAAKDKNDKNIERDVIKYRMFHEGACWHMIQIIGLLAQGFNFISPNVGLVISFLTALPNYWYYSEFALFYDGGYLKAPMPPLISSLYMKPLPSTAQTSPGFQPANGGGSTQCFIENKKAAEDDATAGYHYFENGKLNVFYKLMTLGFILSSSCVVGPPAVLSYCPDVGYPCIDESQDVWQATMYPPMDASIQSPDSIYADSVKRSKSKNNYVVRHFEGREEFEGFTLVIEKWNSKSTLFVANRDSAVSEENIMFRYNPFVQLESTATKFKGQFVTKECPGSEIYDVEKQLFPASREKTCQHPENIVGITLASLQDQAEIFGIQAMAYGLRSRFEKGNVGYHVFFGGSTPGTLGFKPVDEHDEQKIMVIETWAGRSLTKHMESKTVDYVKKAGALVSVPTSIFMASPFVEVFPQSSPNCKGTTK